MYVYEVTYTLLSMMDERTDLNEVSAMELSQVTAPLSESDRARLTEYWSRVITDAGVDVPGRREAPAYPARRARRVRRQRTVHLVRVLPSACRDAAAGSSGVAAWIASA